MAASKFTPELTSKIIEALKTTGLVRASELAGIDRHTLRSWQRNGERDIADNKNTGYADFVREVRRVTANRYAILESSILIAATKDRDWRAGAWLLERTLPEQYGPKNFTQIQVKGELQGLLAQIEPLMSRPAYAELLSALQQVLGDKGDGLEPMDSPEASPAIQ